MAKKFRKPVKTGVDVIRKLPSMPKGMKMLPPDALFLIDSQIQLELLKTELERTCPTYRAGAQKTTALMRVHDEKSKALALT